MATRKTTAKRAEPLTASAVVALNFRRIREERGWSQAEAGRRLEKTTGRPWSIATVSSAERSWERGVERAFGVNELDAISQAFNVSMLEMLLPPSRDETTRRLPSGWVRRLVWSESKTILSRVEALAYDKRNAGLMKRLAGGEKSLRVAIKKAQQSKLKRLATALRGAAVEIEKASRDNRS